MVCKCRNEFFRKYYQKIFEKHLDVDSYEDEKRQCH